MTHSHRIDLVSPNIKRYVADKRKYLTCNPQYHLHVGSLTKSKNHEEANRHSVSIELVDYNMSRTECLRAKKKERKRCESSLRDARNWAFLNYTEPLQLDYIRDLGAIVEPCMNSEGFRRDSVRVSGSRVSPPSAEKVYRELGLFCLENELLANPLEKALHAHFNLARVHPFNDGNGRTSRLVQDTILHKAELPYPTITLAERGEYIEKIEQAVYSLNEKESQLSGENSQKLQTLRNLAMEDCSFKNPEKKAEAVQLTRELAPHRISAEQHYFYDFLALKVLNGLTQEIGRLYPTDKEMIRYFKKNRRN